MIGFEFELQHLKYGWGKDHKRGGSEKSQGICKIEMKESKSKIHKYEIFDSTSQTEYLIIKPKDSKKKNRIILTEDTNNVVEIIAGPYYYYDQATIENDMGYVNELAMFMEDAWNGETGDFFNPCEYMGCYISGVKKYMEYIIANSKKEYSVEIGYDERGKEHGSFEDIYIGRIKKRGYQKRHSIFSKKKQIHTPIFGPQVTVTWPLNKLDCLLEKYYNQITSVSKGQAGEVIEKALVSLKSLNELRQTSRNIIDALNNRGWIENIDEEKLNSLILLISLFLKFGAGYDKKQDPIMKDFTPLLWKNNLFELHHKCFDKDERKVLKSLASGKEFDFLIGKFYKLSRLVNNKFVEGDPLIGKTVNAKTIIKSILSGESGDESEQNSPREVQIFASDERKEVIIYKNELNGNLYDDIRRFWSDIPLESIKKDDNKKNYMGPVLELRRAFPTYENKLFFRTKEKNPFLEYANVYRKWFFDIQK